jgi:hypothetical protein
MFAMSRALRMKRIRLKHPHETNSSTLSLDFSRLSQDSFHRFMTAGDRQKNCATTLAIAAQSGIRETFTERVRADITGAWHLSGEEAIMIVGIDRLCCHRHSRMAGPTRRRRNQNPRRHTDSHDRLEFRDPFGNRIELIGRVKTPG